MFDEIQLAHGLGPEPVLFLLKGQKGGLLRTKGPLQPLLFLRPPLPCGGARGQKLQELPGVVVRKGFVAEEGDLADELPAHAVEGLLVAPDLLLQALGLPLALLEAGERLLMVTRQFLLTAPDALQRVPGGRQLPLGLFRGRQDVAGPLHLVPGLLADARQLLEGGNADAELQPQRGDPFGDRVVQQGKLPFKLLLVPAGGQDFLIKFHGEGLAGHGLILQRLELLGRVEKLLPRRSRVRENPPRIGVGQGAAERTGNSVLEKGTQVLVQCIHTPQHLRTLLKLPQGRPRSLDLRGSLGLLHAQLSALVLHPQAAIQKLTHLFLNLAFPVQVRRQPVHLLNAPFAHGADLAPFLHGLPLQARPEKRLGPLEVLLDDSEPMRDVREHRLPVVQRVLGVLPSPQGVVVALPQGLTVLLRAGEQAEALAYPLEGRGELLVGRIGLKVFARLPERNPGLLQRGLCLFRPRGDGVQSRLQGLELTSGLLDGVLALLALLV